MGLLVGVGAVALSGCIPLSVRMFNGIDTRIVDQATGQPVAGAKVTLTARCAANSSTQSAASGPDGRVTVKPVSRLIWFALLPIDYFDPPGSLKVEAEGYETFTATKAGEWDPRSCAPRPSVMQSGPPGGLPLTRAAGDSRSPR